MAHNGRRGRTQRYKCKDCGRRFDGGIRRDKSRVITDYVKGKQTLSQLAFKYDVSERTIRRDLGGKRYVQKVSKYKQVTIQMNTTYWSRNRGSAGTTTNIIAGMTGNISSRHAQLRLGCQ